MSERLTMELASNHRRGSYDVRLDGEWIGWVTAATPATWIMTCLYTPPDATPLDEDPREGRRPNRHDAIVFGLNRAGLPQSVVEALLYGWTLSPALEEYVTAFLDKVRT